MSLTIKDNGGNFELPPAGTHLARCYRMIDLGTQISEFDGNQKQQHKILIVWELPLECTSDGKPFSISKRYTASLNERATLRKELEAWRGRAFTPKELEGFHMGKILGQWCLLSIVHTNKNGKDYANINSVMALPKGTQTPEGVNSALMLDLSPELYNHADFESLSDGLKEVIKKSPEWKALNEQSASLGAMSDECPPDIDLMNEEDIPF